MNLDMMRLRCAMLVLWELASRASFVLEEEYNLLGPEKLKGFEFGRLRKGGGWISDGVTASYNSIE